MTARPRSCPAPECHERLPRSRFACPRHWRALPAHARRDVTAAYTAYVRVGREGGDLIAAIERLTEAQDAATELLNQEATDR